MFLPLGVSAQIGGRTVYDYWRVPVSARLLSMGSVNVSTQDDDVSFVTQNPALLNDSMHRKVAVSFCNYLADIRHGYAATSLSFDKAGSFYAGIASLGSGDMQGADVYGNPTGNTFAARDVTWSLGYANAYKSIRYGAALKFISSNLATGYSAGSFGMATDVGASYRSKNQLFGAGLVFKNVGAQLSRYTPTQQNAPTPFEIQAGITNKLKYMPLRFSVQLVQLNRPRLIYKDPNAAQEYDLAGNPIKAENTFADNTLRHVVFGGEFLFGKGFRIRGGYNHMRRMELRPVERALLTGFSLGMGIRTKRLDFDYGYGSFGTNAALLVHQFSLILNIDGVNKE